MANPKRVQYFTPIGVFKYCHLNKADTRYKAEGEYSVVVLLDKADAETQKLTKALDRLHKEAYDNGVERMKEANGQQKGKWKTKGLSKPTLNPYYNDECNDEGDPTGRIELRMKTKALFEDKQGNTVKKSVALVDGRGQIIKDTKRPLVYAGTEGRVAFAAASSFIPKEADVYLSFYLNQVQITKLVTGGGGTSAFGAVEDSDFDGDELEEYEAGASDDTEDQDTGGDSGDLDEDDIPF